ncbi:hypothetical protein LPJ78_005280 [Coemansia sp. RSA 989]|nr:transferase [Coemansia mojavensis]KAJ1739010.1 hypothetical protein LPJ68_005056 [Coemansia sp. RSA 1086]KAJ1747447.1 hypothetical protein LPJ79_005240 [Coemansia sp. RSA 1821]KAJ1861523.1 hypothetical protein LPJ78_005280 [Coemansia sp. RSA 989]KAJ1869484.1 hypothetical protein LPJ55_005326 [Coemansia sp. RSA 990]KAJ2668771.1 hypothetical protein IWW42_004976 [Coemansia sp. RSA 1085]
MRLDMGEHLPKEAVSRRITGDTQFMFQFYKPCFQFFQPGDLVNRYMSQASLKHSLIVALHECPLLFGRFKIHDDLSISLEYNPASPNMPTLEFQTADLTYSELESRGFAYSLARQHSMDLPIPDGTVTRDFDQPMLMVKVTYFTGGGVAVFCMTNHVAFDGNAMFSFIAHWARCNQQLIVRQQSVELPPDLKVYDAALVSNTDNEPAEGPVEISVDATRTPTEIATSITRMVARSSICANVFSIETSSLSKLKQQVADSGVLCEGEWVSSNNVLAAFIAQHIAQANMEGQVYEEGSWKIFQALDMRRPLSLPLHGLGSPIMLAECHASYSELKSAFPLLAKRIRQSVDKYTGEYLQDSMDWMNASYRKLAENGVQEPWRHFWFTAMNTNTRSVGISCMSKIPIYDADFGAGRPQMARSFNPRPNYVIVFPGPPASAGSHDSLHLYVTLERPAMEALKSDPAWSSVCSLISEF